MNKIYKFKDKDLDMIWKTHPSYSENNEFQRMEFFGDKIISYCLSEYLINQEPKLSEGQLSLNLENMVSKNALGSIAHFLKDDILYKDVLNDKILSDCLEAWVGCVFLDGGDIKSIIASLWQEKLQITFKKNAKNELQELLQSKNQSPIYIYQSSQEGFRVKLRIDNLEVETIGTSKKEASIKAAELMMQKLRSSLKLDNIEQKEDLNRENIRSDDFFITRKYNNSNSSPLSQRKRSRIPFDKERNFEKSDRSFSTRRNNGRYNDRRSDTTQNETKFKNYNPSFNKEFLDSRKNNSFEEDGQKTSNDSRNYRRSSRNDTSNYGNSSQRPRSSRFSKRDSTHTEENSFDRKPRTRAAVGTSALKSRPKIVKDDRKKTFFNDKPRPSYNRDKRNRG